MTSRASQRPLAIASAVQIILPKTQPNDLSEAAWQREVETLLDIGGWMRHHNADSRQADAGLLDIVACRPPVLLFAELKTKSGRLRKGHQVGDIVRGRNGRTRVVTRPEPGQVEWIAALQQCPGVIVRVWRPVDWRDAIYTICGDDVYYVTYGQHYGEAA